MNQIIFATSNKGKIKEVRDLLFDLPYEILSLEDAGIHINILENGSSFEENALIKARALYQYYKEHLWKDKENCPIMMADDSGLEVDYMNKEPGIYSARFMGEDTSYDIKNQFIIDRLAGVMDSERTARFVCSIACIFPDGSDAVTSGTVEGIIGYHIAGENGFGYDPIFYLPEYGCTSAELSLAEKNKISHRGRAIQKMKVLLR